MSPVRFELKGKRVYVAGHRGMAGSALLRRLAREDCELITADAARSISPIRRPQSAS
jgi:GDP-L-fucose synthase